MKILIVILIFTKIVLGSDAKFDSLINKGINHIYNIEFNDANITFDEVSKLYPESPSGEFFKAMVIWWEIMLDFSNETLDKKFVNKLEEIIDKCDDILSEKPADIDAIFFKAGSLGFRGKLYSVRKSWLNAALDGKDALPLVHEAYRVAPDNMDVQLGFGTYNYYAAIVPEKYPFVKPFMFMFPKGNKEEGISQLEKAAKFGKYAKYEASYFLMTLYLLNENEFQKALEHAENLHNKFPNNPTFERYYGKIFVKKNQFDKAENVFNSIINKFNNSVKGYNIWMKREANYYLGIVNENKKNFNEAIANYKESILLTKKLDEEFEESGFVINSYLQLGEIYYKTGDLKNAKKHLEIVLDLDDYNDSHDKAEKILKNFK